MSKPKEKGQPGPDPEKLRLEGDWEGAIDKALGRKRPEGGWPRGKPADEEPVPEKGVKKPDQG